MEVLILLMIGQVENVSQTNLNLNVFNMITRINEKKHQQNIFHVIVKVNLMAADVIQIKSGVKNYIDVNGKTQ